MNGEITAGLLFLFLVGIAGWKLFSFLKFPSPDMLGALFLAAGLGMSGIRFAFPTGEVTFLCKLVIGSYIGLKIDRTVLRQLRKALLPGVLVSIWMLVLSVGSGFLLYFSTHLPLSTALLGSTTGGLSEMALLAFSIGADTVTITILQLFRVILYLVSMPLFARFVSSRMAGTRERRAITPTENVPQEPTRPGSRGVVRLIVVAIAGGLAGRGLGIPAGDLLGSMAAVGFFNTFSSGFPRVNPTLQSLARIGVGLAIAQEVTPKTVELLSEMLLPVTILAVLMISSAILLSWVLYKITDWNYSTCLLVSSPGGLTQMSMIADEVNADPVTVSVLHTVRLISILAVLPLFFRFLMG
ncbi:MAG: AbrB family transcriptional regulator [Thermovirgaceae bacterium]